MNECKDIIEQLSLMYSPAKSLLSDDVFIELLNEEIDLFRKSGATFPGKVCFTINENSDVVYEGIYESIPKDFMGMTVVISPQKIHENIVKETLPKLSPAELEKQSLAEKIKQFSQDLKTISEDLKDSTIKAALIDAMNEQVKQYSESISKKKEKLLDKLLEEQE